MLFKNATRQVCVVEIRREAVAVAPAREVTTNDAAAKDELRRQLYERIARGNALAEAEEHARRTWNGR